MYCFLYCSMYCLCVNVYCHRVTTQLQLTNISYHINVQSVKCRQRYFRFIAATVRISLYGSAWRLRQLLRQVCSARNLLTWATSVSTTRTKISSSGCEMYRTIPPLLYALRKLRAPASICDMTPCSLVVTNPFSYEGDEGDYFIWVYLVLWLF